CHSVESIGSSQDYYLLLMTDVDRISADPYAQWSSSICIPNREESPCFARQMVAMIIKRILRSLSARSNAEMSDAWIVI
ncbi:unnamed protein product, partial [Mycena citricolor]